MMKDIKDYLHLYLGFVDWMVTTETMYYGRDENAHALAKEGDVISINILTGHFLLRYGAYGSDWITYLLAHAKPILRPLSDMTEEEVREYFIVCSLKPGDYIGSGPDWIPISARSTAWLLSKGFDLFGLIEAGLAIDKTKEVSHD